MGAGSKARARSAKKIWQWVCVCCLWGLLLAAGFLIWCWYDLPNLAQLDVATRRPRIEFLDPQGQKIMTYGDTHFGPVPLSAVPAFLPKAILAIEDHRFYEHRGLDFMGMGRALITNVGANRLVQGGSTLTQQLAKTLFLTPKRSVKRKIQELIVALWLEKKFSKNQLLGIYINRVYLGPGLYGFGAAAKFYFNKPLQKLTLPEAAGLAGMLKAPYTYSPFYNLPKFKQRAQVVLERMLELSYITKAQHATADGQVRALKPPPAPFLATSRPSVRYFLDWVYSQLPELVDTATQDLVVTTTYSARGQQALDTALEIMTAQPVLEDAQAALVLMKTDGRVLGMVGGRGYFSTAYNRAWQSTRQSGSVFKVFIYLNALAKGLTLTSAVKDTPLNLSGWRPKNYGWVSRGTMPLADTFAYSINTAAVRLAKETGIQDCVKLAHRFGAIAKLPAQVDLTASLGTMDSTLLGLSNAFASLASGCKKTVPYGILSIKTAGGKLLYAHDAAQIGPGLVSQGACTALEALMMKAVDYGTAKNARTPGRPRAAKTGTTQRHQDAWIVGWERPYVLGIWVGNDDGQPLPGNMTGGRLPAQLFKHVLDKLGK